MIQSFGCISNSENSVNSVKNPGLFESITEMKSEANNTLVPNVAKRFSGTVSELASNR